MLPVAFESGFNTGADGELIVPVRVMGQRSIEVCFAKDALLGLFGIQPEQVASAGLLMLAAIRQAAWNVLDAQGWETLKAANRVWVRSNGYFVE